MEVYVNYNKHPDISNAEQVFIEAKELPPEDFYWGHPEGVKLACDMIGKTIKHIRWDHGMLVLKVE